MDAVAEHGHSHPASRRPRKPPRPGRDAKQDCSRTSPSTAFSWIRLPLRHREQEHDDNAAALSLLVRSEHLVEPRLSSRSPRGGAAAGLSYWRDARLWGGPMAALLCVLGGCGPGFDAGRSDLIEISRSVKTHRPCASIE
jgi:hypothetical protein